MVVFFVVFFFQDRNLDLPSPSRKPRVYRDERSAEEITDEDLELVATCVADKKYDTIYVCICFGSDFLSS